MPTTGAMPTRLADAQSGLLGDLWGTLARPDGPPCPTGRLFYTVVFEELHGYVMGKKQGTQWMSDGNPTIKTGALGGWNPLGLLGGTPILRLVGRPKPDRFFAHGGSVGLLRAKEMGSLGENHLYQSQRRWRCRKMEVRG